MTEDSSVQEEKQEQQLPESMIFALRTSANREDQVIDFVSSNVKRKKLPVYSLVFPPVLLVTNAVQRAVMRCTEWDCPFIANFTAKSLRLGET